MAFKFCPHCGTALTSKPIGGRERPTCPACGHSLFGRFSIGVGGLLMQGDKVLLVQRGENPGLGRWTIPGGYVEEDETPDLAVAREVMEETALRVRAVELLALRNTLRDNDQNAYYVFRLALAGPAEITIDGHETVRAGFYAPPEFDSLGDVAPFSRWIAEHHADAGLRRIKGDELLAPLVGNKWVLYGIPPRLAGEARGEEEI